MNTLVRLKKQELPPFKKIFLSGVFVMFLCTNNIILQALAQKVSETERQKYEKEFDDYYKELEKAKQEYVIYTVMYRFC